MRHPGARAVGRRRADPRGKDIIDNAYGDGVAAARARGELVWPGLLRRLNRVDPSYQD